MKIERGFSAALTLAIVSALVTIGTMPAHADPTRVEQWYLKALNITKAHQISTGESIAVAVIDSGVFPHPDLHTNLLNGASFVKNDSGNGQTDPYGHGTEMAGLIAAHGGPEGAGILGIAPNAKIIPVRTLDASGQTTNDILARGFLYAKAQKARVINASLGVAPSMSLNKALAEDLESDAVIVASAGNSRETLNSYPAAFPGVLAVGASTRSGKPATFSFANSNVQICAPGVGIETIASNNKYENGDGTSQATAIVSGAAALVRARFPELSAAEVIHRITATATDIGAPEKCGAGIIDVVKALTADVPPLGGTPAGTTPASRPAAGPSSSGGVAAPGGESAGVKVVAIVGGVLGVLLVGGLVAFLVRRRRGSSA